MSQTTKQKMLSARSLIETQQYQDAYELLLTVDHPKAQEWIERLQPKLEVSEDDAYVPKKGKGVPMLKPWNPKNFYFFYIWGIIGIIANFVLSFNWKRLGRPKWVLPSLALSVGLPVFILAVTIGLLLTGTTSGVTESTPFIVLGFICAIVTFYVFSFSLPYIQSSAYKVWEKQGNQALLEHDYNLKRVLLIDTLISIVVIMLLGGYVIYLTVPVEYESDFIRLDYQRTWDIENHSEFEECSYEWIQCEIILSESKYVYTGLMVQRIDIDPSYTLNEWMNDDVVYWETTLENLTYSSDTYTIGGQDALRLYTNYDMENDRISQIDIYVLHNGNGLFISTWSGCGGCLREDLPKIMKVIDSIEFVD